MVDPDLDEAGGGDVVVFVADFVGGAEGAGEVFVVGGELGEHGDGGDEVGIVVLQALVL